MFCTSICTNYIPKAKALATSLKQHNPGAAFVVCLVEKTIHPAAFDPKLFDLVITADELGIEDFESFMFKHSVVEAATAIKGHLFRNLLRRFPNEDYFVYLDPDILVTGTFTELSEPLRNHAVILIPHLSEPEDNLDAIRDNEICALKHGVFNLGFLALKRCAVAQRFLDWWSTRLIEFCYADIEQGLFTDQKWVNLAPCFFDVFIFKHPGYNVAPWNLSRRHLRQSEQGDFYVGEFPLRFFHFSGFDSGANRLMVQKYCPDETNAVYLLKRIYVTLIDTLGQQELGNLPWSYDFYDNGTKIKTSHRSIYQSSQKLQLRFKNPFDATTVPSFFRYVRYKSVLGLREMSWLREATGQLFSESKAAYQRGGGKLLMIKGMKYIKRKLSRPVAKNV